MIARASQSSEAPDDSVGELVARAARGDEAAYGRLYDLHGRYVAGVAYRLLGRDDELEDVVQETFVEGLRAIGKLREPSQFRFWITTIAIRRVKRRLAERYRRRDLAARVEPTSARVSDPELQEEVAALYRALDGIDEDLRLPWILHHIEGETLPRVAVLCETSLSTAKRRIARAEVLLDRRLHAQ
jgi:RNA polymerase sigma-70 factor (ECF subfamily)